LTLDLKDERAVRRRIVHIECAMAGKMGLPVPSF
jgi:hypothetical protein